VKWFEFHKGDDWCVVCQWDASSGDIDKEIKEARRQTSPEVLCDHKPEHQFAIFSLQSAHQDTNESDMRQIGSYLAAHGWTQREPGEGGWKRNRDLPRPHLRQK
jgi:hypothetical protein